MKPRHLIPALLCALLIGYPLSLGPVARIDVMTHPVGFMGSTAAFQAYYAPMMWINPRSPFLRHLLNGYVNLWLPSEIVHSVPPSPD